MLGVLQGLAEFLPISSSAHLALAPWLFGWKDPGLAFDVALHLGTLCTVLWYFRADWTALTRSGWSIVRERRVASAEQWRVVYLIIATIPAAIAGLPLCMDFSRAPFIFRPDIIPESFVCNTLCRNHPFLLAKRFHCILSQ